MNKPLKRQKSVYKEVENFLACVVTLIRKPATEWRKKDLDDRFPHLLSMRAYNLLYKDKTFKSQWETLELLIQIKVVQHKLKLNKKDMKTLLDDLIT
jgi:hypothetical protein